MTRSIKITRVSAAVIRRTVGLPKVVEAFESLDKVLSDEEKINWLTPDERITREKAQKQADLAREEVESGFRWLNSNAFVVAWAYLETWMDDLLIGLVDASPGWIDEEQWDRVKVRASDYLKTPPDELTQWLIAEAEKYLSQQNLRGIGYFEERLRLVGLAGPVPKDVRDGIFVFQQIRNLVAHRAGTVDQHFAKACPMLSVTVGEPLQLSLSAVLTAGLTAVRYGGIVTQRVCEKCGDESARLSATLAKVEASEFSLVEMLNRRPHEGSVLSPRQTRHSQDRIAEVVR